MAAATPEQVIAIANAGAGPLADLAKQAKTAFALDAEQAKNYGAGFVSDLLRQGGLPPEPPEPEPEPISAALKSVSNQNPAVVTVNTADYPNFAVGTITRFENTGNETLDAPEATFAVTGINGVDRTFRIAADLSEVAAPVATGTIFVVPQAAKSAKGRQSPPKAVTILTDPPPGPKKVKPDIPNGYENEKQEKA